MKKIALAITNNLSPTKDFESIWFADRLRKAGAVVEELSWLDKSVNWADFDIVLVNNCFGYHNKIQQFSDWLEGLKRQKVKVLNSIDCINWNSNKFYLKDLEKKNFSILPTIWVEENAVIDVALEVKARNWNKIIIKPTISAGSSNTYVLSNDEIAKNGQNFLNAILQNCAAMIQEFKEIVVSKGEYSAIFFGKEFSHLVLKTPAAGDFRAGLNQGASVQALDEFENKKIVAYAQNIVDAIDYDLLYARVDLIEVEGKIYIMEVELIEPLLYLQANENLAANYVNKIINH